MKILLVAATAKEIDPFLIAYKKMAKENTMFHEISVMITGIGLTATTYKLTKQIARQSPELIIQAGVAGCFDREMDLGEVVIIKKDTIADESVIELAHLKTLFDLKLVPQNNKPYQKGWLNNPHLALIKKTKLKSVTGISVNQITTGKKQIGFYRDHFNPIAESMEGAALHYTCLMENIPFLQIRSFSNYIGERNRDKWKMKESIINLNEQLINFLEIL